MKQFFFTFIIFLGCIQLVTAQVILPTPFKLIGKEGVFKLSKKTCLLAKSEETQGTVAYFQRIIENSTGYLLETACAPIEARAFISFELSEELKHVGNEGYILDVDSVRIKIKAHKQAGLFYAVQSLLQLMPEEVYSKTMVNNITWLVPCMYIEDQPKYSWRSFMLDSGRQYQSLEFIKRYLDLMALLKMNVFHWHLTESQGWRIEIKKYPRLTSVGSKVANSAEQQGFYTQEEIKEIVAYAAKRHIMVVPEIDVPGHSAAAITAYPKYTCTQKAPKELMAKSSVLFCGGRESTYQFLEDVLDEVCDLFPASYIHLGGDEAPKAHWDDCTDCQKRIEEEGLENSHQLQLYFSKRLALYLKEKNMKAIFWGDVVYTDGVDLPDNTVIYWWNWRAHKDKAYKNAIKRGHPVICGTNNYNYLNFPVTPWSRYKVGRTFDLRMTYEENPSNVISPDSLVLGMGCCLWTDWYVQEHMIDQRVFPRIFSMAQQMWYKQKPLDFEEFYTQVKSKYQLLDILEVDYGPALIEEVPLGYSWD